MAALKGSHRRYLRGVAHGYRPVVQIGKEGLAESVLRAIDLALAARELIKVQIAAERGLRQELVPLIEARLSCECVGVIGRVAILYRQHPDPDKRVIRLPDQDQTQ